MYKFIDLYTSIVRPCFRYEGLLSCQAWGLRCREASGWLQAKFYLKFMGMNLEWMALLLNGTISLSLFQYKDSRQITQTYDSCQTIGSIIESWCCCYYNHWFVPVVVAFVKAHLFGAESHSTLEWMNSVHQRWRVIIYSRLLNFAHLTELLQTSRWISKEVRICSTFLFYSDQL